MSPILRPTNSRKLSMPAKFAVGRAWPRTRILSMRAMVDDLPNQSLRIRNKWNNILARPDNYELAGPPAVWDFPAYYRDPAGNEAMSLMVRTDATAAVDYALRYAVMGDTVAASQAVKILNAYGTISSFVDKGDSAFAWHRRWPLFMQAGVLLEGSSLYSGPTKTALKATTRLGDKEFKKIAYEHTNNFAAVGIAYEIFVSGFLDDRTRFDKALIRWREHFEDSVRSGIVMKGEVRYNIPIYEVYRQGAIQGNGKDGLVYANTALAGLAMGAEYARLYGEWLFDYRSADGSTLKGLYENVAFWSRFAGTPGVLWFNTSNQEDPSSPDFNQGYRITNLKPWVDILGALWPNDDVAFLMDAYPYTSTEDIYTLRNAELIYRGRPLYG